MKKILYVNACVRPESRTDYLARHLLSKLDGIIDEVRLQEEKIKALDLKTLQYRDSLIEKGDFSDDIFRYARQFAEADMVVMAAPYWDLSFPAMIKDYMEAVSVQGLVFHYTDKGIPEGMTNIKKVIYVTTAGGPVGDMNLGYDYIKAVCSRLYSIDDVVCHKAEMLDIIGADVNGILEKTVREIDEIYG